MTREKFLLVDGSSLVYRAFFALPLLQTRQGHYTNAVYGFTNMLLKLLAEEKPEYVAVAFDRAAPTFRHLEYGEYKAKREKTPDELSGQLTSVREVLDGLGIRVVEADGYEADDIIGTLSRQANAAGLQPVIVTGDADIFQLVDLPAQVIYTRRGITLVERYDGQALRERYGLSAAQFIDYKALKGDASDNIPGVPGIGEKTAIRLLREYGDLDGIYHNLERIGGKLREALENNREAAYLCRRLAAIVTDMPVAFKLEDFRRGAQDTELLRRLFAELEFKSLLDRLPEQTAARREAGEKREAYSVIERVNGRDWPAALRREKMFAVFTLPAGQPWQQGLSALAVALPAETVFVEAASLDAAAGDVLLALDIQVITGDAKAWRNHCLRLFGREPAGDVQDAALAAYLLDPLESSYEAEKLAAVYLERQLPPPPARGAGEKREQEYAAACARSLFDLYPVLRGKLSEMKLAELYDNLELPLSAVLSRMEREGVAVDPLELNRLREETCRRILDLEQEIYFLAGREFNLNSPKQLARVLFEELGLPAVKKTKTGYSTDAEVLEELAGQHEAAGKILEYRMLGKLLGTYLEGLSRLVGSDGKLHTTFRQTVTATGRLSSTEPNLQNIPIRLEEGRKIRRAFVPGAAGRLLLSADYSQIELRILAHLSGDDVLIRSFRDEEDIHRRTAAEVFGVHPEEVNRELRDRAKAVNFGIIYGISDYGLSRQLGISRQEARTYIDRYLERYPAVKRYFSSVISFARKTGYVTTILNRRRYLPEINSKNFTRRAFAERTAMNTPIQGSAADIIKLAMLTIDRQLAAPGGEARMILQVHDELLFEVAEECLAETAALIRSLMEEAYPLKVPLTVDVKAGPNWLEMKEINLWRK
jgi:DNA polymerase-1